MAYVYEMAEADPQIIQDEDEFLKDVASYHARRRCAVIKLRPKDDTDQI